MKQAVISAHCKENIQEPKERFEQTVYIIPKQYFWFISRFFSLKGNDQALAPLPAQEVTTL